MPPTISKSKSAPAPVVKKSKSKLKGSSTQAKAEVALKKKQELAARDLKAALAEKQLYDTALLSLLTTIREKTDAVFANASEDSKAVIAAGILDSLGEEIFDVELELAELGGVPAVTPPVPVSSAPENA